MVHLGQNPLRQIGRVALLFRHCKRQEPLRCWWRIATPNHNKRQAHNHQRSIDQIAYACNVANQGHLTSVFKKTFGVTPGALRNDWRSKSFPATASIPGNPASCRITRCCQTNGVICKRVGSGIGMI
ncbi:helix-turn-helix domain-containing protein [Roseobacter weihaiensis]|uniref:helix-turn-helix domain-containing protein n=1 Tax=Roseobacter weihaiensis TaxID=2763262 RepID=UPI001D0A2D1B